MKKIIFGLLLAAFSLTNCSKDEGAEVMPSIEKTPFTISIVPDSRTSNDGMATVWDEGDQVNVFHAETGATAYGTNDPFTCTADEVTAFTGYLTEALEEGKSYDWYVLYPYSEYVKTPKEPTKGYLPVGSESSSVQTQNGNSNMVHIAGANYPLYGNVTNVAAAATPSITMKHVSSLVEFKVTNSTSAPIVVEGIDFTSTEDIVGTYYIDFSDNDAVLTGSGDYYVSSTAKLVVANGEEIAVGESATFYMAIKPHKVENGDLEVVVKTSAGNVEKTFSAINTTFTAGKIKTVKVTVDAFKQFVDYSGTYVIAAKGSGNTLYYMSVADGSSGNNRKAVNTGVETFPASLNSISTMSNAARWIVSKVEDEECFTLQSADNNKYLAIQSNANRGEVVDDVASAAKVTIDKNSDGSFVLTSVAYPSRMLQLNTSNGIYAFYGSDSDVTVLMVEAPNALLDMSVEGNVELTADAASGAVSVNLANNEGWAITVSDNADWLTTTFADNQVSYVVTANEGDAREATVTLTATKDTETKEITFVIKQTGVNVTSYTKVTDIANITTGSYLIVYEEKNIAADGSKDVDKTGIGAQNTNVSVVINGTSISGNSEIDAATFTITKNSDFYTIQNGSGIYLSSQSGTNGLVVGDSAEGTHKCAITLNDDGTANIANFDSTTLFVYNSSGFFRFYKNSTAAGSNYKKLSLYKLDE